jgi:hypothetical protein
MQKRGLTGRIKTIFGMILTIGIIIMIVTIIPKIVAMITGNSGIFLKECQDTYKKLKIFF